MSLGAMQDWPLRVTRLIDHAEREHATREIVSARADGSTIRTDWKHLAMIRGAWPRRSNDWGFRRATA